jgi:FAD/FMN-containing dehydrogenase
MSSDTFLIELKSAAGAAVVFDDSATRYYYANDIFWQPGIAPLAVVVPESRQQAAEAVKVAARHKISLVPRGGGMSYTKGYIPQSAQSIVIDTRKLNKVLEVNVADSYITVEAGCTWAQVHKALEGTGVNTGYWGPLSGNNATVGGALSQNSAFFGSGIHGTVANNVLGVTVLLANGETVTTGSGGRTNTKPFTRYAGPDITGMFLGDTGAFGLKLAATLKLVPEAKDQDFLGFGFKDMTSMVLAQTEMSHLYAVATSFGIDRSKALNSASVNKLADGVKIIGNVAKAAKGWVQGIKDVVSVVAAGENYLADHACSLHLVVEGRSLEDLNHNMEALRAIGRKYGIEISNAAARVMRSKPFNPVRGMLGAEGQRWVPIHSVFPMSEAARVVAASDAYFESQRALIEQHGIILSHLTMTVAGEFFFEPAFYWLDEITPLHRKSVGEDVVAPWLSRPANVEAREAVATLRQGIQAVYVGLGGVNWQIARDYPFKDVQQPSTWALLTSLKTAVDPDGIMNPGSLGFSR